MRFDIHVHFDVQLPTEAQDQLDEISRKLGLVLKREDKIMSAATDLNNAVSALARAFATEHDAVTAEFAALSTALANSTDPALSDAVTQAISNVTHITGQMATDAAALTASIPAATTVAPPDVTQPATPSTATPPTIDVPAVTDPNAAPPTS